MADPNTLDALTSKVIRQRRTGYTFEEIAEREAVSVADVVACWSEYVKSRTVMDLFEWRTLHELRLENLLVRLNDRIDQNLSSGKVDDIRNATIVLDQIEKLHAINTERQAETAEMLRQISIEQAKVIVGALYRMLAGVKDEILGAFAEYASVEEIQAQVTDVLDNRALPIAQKALEGAGQEQE